ncbi:MAG TPA: toll/interleukin-1 receptor domain-containing protein, partial [Candidatus Angelobacter sp.]|nr:toll/interleukin-1 receptor domain-containing protein [Candidatus Angelobacter sp.]
MTGTSSFSFDIFLSHNRAQKDWTRKLAIQFEDKGITVWFDDWHMPAGTVATQGMELGLQQSRHVLLVLSPEFLLSEWTDYETQIAMVLSPANRDRKLVPIL